MNPRRVPPPWGTRARVLLLVFSLFCLPGGPASALALGQNKVRYHTDHHWKVLESDHFEIYHYQGCEGLAATAAGYAENAFVHTSRLFGFVPRNKIPLFIYATPLEFQETNVTQEVLSEGVGGFTEVFKNRIVIPMNGSYHEFEKVITHELTHAFQYDLIYGEGWRSINLFKAVFAPTWMMEGMAEWNARHLDTQGDMVLRDAVLNDQLIPLNLLESFGHFPQVYMAYKESQSVLDYVTQVYGEDKVPLLMKKMSGSQQPDAAIKGTLGITLDELYDHWRFFMKSAAWSRIKGLASPERYGEVVEKDAAKASVAPDGSRVAILKARELLLYDPVRKERVSLVHRSFETQGSGVAWSPDGKRLAYTAARNGEVGLYTFDLGTRREKELALKGLPLVYSPAWSLDGRFIVFCGFDDSSVDLYRIEVGTGATARLTEDQDTENWPSYSAEGDGLFYISESSGRTKVKMIYLDTAGMPIGDEVDVTGDESTITSIHPMKGSLFLTSDRNGRIFNLYRADLDGGNLTQLTASYADVLNAAPSPDGSVIYADVYQKAAQTLYAFPAGLLEGIKSPPEDLKFLADSFEGAGKVIAAPAPSATRGPDGEVLPEGTPVEAAKDKNQAVEKVPAPLPSLEVAEASNLVVLQWPAQENEDVEKYRVYRSSSPDQGFVTIGEQPASKSGRFADYDVVTGRTYRYFVTGVNLKGESAPSSQVEAVPTPKSLSREAGFRLTPDLVLFLAGYDSSFGFVGGGIFQMSDYMGDHRFGVLGDTIPGVRSGLEADYEFAGWRTTVDLDFYYYQNFFRILDLQTGNLVNEYRNNVNGLDINFSYPVDQSTRVEYGLGTQRFQGSPLYLQFSEGISNYSLSQDQWSVANYYRLSLVHDKRRAENFWPNGGYAFNLTLLHALPVLDSNVTFANILLEAQSYVDIGFLNHLIWANRWIGMTSQGPDPQTFFIGEDAPFQAFFTTIRGYGNGTYFGSNLGLWNMEFRYPLATNMDFPLQPLSFILMKDIELAGFMDLGSTFNQFSEISQAPLLASAGCGIRFYSFVYQRALVMLRFDVAWRLDQDLPPTFYFNLAPMF